MIKSNVGFVNKKLLTLILGIKAFATSRKNFKLKRVDFQEVRKLLSEQNTITFKINFCGCLFFNLESF